MKKRFLSVLLALTLMIPCISAMGITSNAAVTSSEGMFPFKDVIDSDWYYESAHFCYINGIIQGQGNSYTFAPNVELSRATFVVMMARVLGADLENYTETSFSDCPAGTWYTPSVEWAAEQGYVNGTGAGKFSPDAVVDREQAATLISRLIDKLGFEVEVSEGLLEKFGDHAEISEWAKDGAEKCVAAEILLGTLNYTFAPKTKMTRSQVAVTFMRFLNNVYFADCEHELVDADCTKGQHCAKCGLIFTLPNGHSCDKLTCNEGGVCNTCGKEVAPDPGLHKYSTGNCTTPEQCSVCGDVRKAAPGHNFSAATCIAPKTCTVCKATQGSALGHTTKFGICSRCKGEVFASKYLRAAYYMVEKGNDNGKGQYTLYTYYEFDDGSVDVGVLYYDAVTATYCLVYTYFWADGNHLSVAIDIPKVSSSYKFAIGYFDGDENEISSSEGTINSGSVSATNIPYSFTSHSGSNAYREWMTSLTEEMLLDCLYYNDYILDYLCNEGVEIFGFPVLE